LRGRSICCPVTRVSMLSLGVGGTSVCILFFYAWCGWNSCSMEETPIFLCVRFSLGIMKIWQLEETPNCLCLAKTPMVAGGGCLCLAASMRAGGKANCLCLAKTPMVAGGNSLAACAWQLQWQLEEKPTACA
jgi:hypothetical protein